MPKNAKVFEKNADIHAKGTTKKEQTMGMAASQARLLSITSRIHDVEYQAQMIQSAKLQLALHEDEAFRKYNEALDAQTLTFQDLKGNRIAATFNNLCGLGSINNDIAGNNMYVFRDGSDNLIVPSDVYDGYVSFGGNDPYQFAIFMLAGDTSKDEISEKELLYFQNDIPNDGTDGIYEKYKEKISNLINTIYKNTTCGEGGTGVTDEQKKTLLEHILSDGTVGSQFFTDIPEPTKDDIESLEKIAGEYKYMVYNRDGAAIYSSISGDKEENFDQDKFNYYLKWGKLIQNEFAYVDNDHIRGCTRAGDYQKDIENDPELLNQMIQAGRIFIDMVSLNKKGEVEDKTTSAASDSNIAFTNKTSIDQTELKRAEAEYEKTMKDIDRKDKQYDMDLSKLETERTALTKEYDSVKQVIKDNIERTFGIFS